MENLQNFLKTNQKYFLHVNLLQGQDTPFIDCDCVCLKDETPNNIAMELINFAKSSEENKQELIECLKEMDVNEFDDHPDVVNIVELDGYNGYSYEEAMEDEDDYLGWQHAENTKPGTVAPVYVEYSLIIYMDST